MQSQEGNSPLLVVTRMSYNDESIARHPESECAEKHEWSAQKVQVDFCTIKIKAVYFTQ